MQWTLYIVLLCCLIVSKIFVECTVVKDISYWRLRYIVSSEDAQSTRKPKYNENNFNFPKEDGVLLPSLNEYNHPTVRQTTTTEAAFASAAANANDFTTTMEPMRKGNSNEKFSAKLYEIMATQSDKDNLIFSPFSIQSLLTILYIGAEHLTATQLRIGLELPEKMSDVLNQFHSIVSETQRRTSTKDFEMSFAQKIYFKNEFNLLYGIEDMAKKYFHAQIAPISFDSAAAAATPEDGINRWVAKETHNRITNIIAPYTLDAETELVLVNVIYMKAKWRREFSTSDTIKQEFYVANQAKPIIVDMMYTEDDFRFGDFPELDARIVELPFLDTDLSMLIILPNQLDGLARMESRLKSINLNNLLEKMRYAPITLRMPKFKVESNLDMVEPLKKLGIENIFNDQAELGKIFSNGNVKVSKVQHKAFIDVNEGGVEAAAATFIQIVPLSLQPSMNYIVVDHPFMFAIRSTQGVYFMGHVINNFQ